ncbi:Na(+)/H(+) exchange regulatory cofactor NHE-RF2 [Anopheles ziemanni]|uniref:Na(+)/H(+) exchange regulatory cofactor NHE-RF2 n=1 Tax=Anopheles coustani TaxID=139045 RepID=UPI002658245B|nr:Na(+)/H(+) exchange regulatory cofactor NHE-RF2 [Anopheles coustani]XP_058172373.1 Na(+)/H(+) exchange regulatory cofactor NHE-RF2 [Anopheles ziemanni]
MSSKSNSTASNGSTATATMAANGTPKYEARLCHVVKRPDFDGYGFNLHAEKGRPGQYIGKVDDASPAESAGLRQGDRIIEVNGTNITTETHKKVVELIKAVPNETRLLVIDPRADANDLKLALAKSAAAATAAATATPVATNGTANNNNNTISNGTSNGHHANGTTGQKNDKKEAVAAASVEDKSPKTSGNGTTATINNNNSINNNNHSSNGNGSTTPPATMEKIIDDTKKVLTVTDGAVSGKMALNGTTEPAPASQTNGNGTTEPSKTTEGKKLNLPMTAAEMRAQLAARKKYDPKSEVCDLRKKYEIIQKM